MTAKNKYVIGLDLDNTLAEASIITLAAKEVGLEEYSDYTPRDWTSSTFPVILRDRINEMYISNKYMCDNLKIIKGSKELIKKLKNKGHKLIIITARYYKLEKKTRSFIKKNFPEIDEIYFVDPYETKKGLFKKFKLDFWIDDAPHEIMNSILLGIKSFMISNETTKYNWHMKKITGLKVIKSVKELRLKDFKK
jgi:uncharacterized HAD superfamily protein